MTQNNGTIGFQGVTDGLSNTALWSEGVSGSNLPVQAGTGKLNELRTFFQAGTSNNANSLPIGSPNGVTSFLAQCNSLQIGTLGNTTTPRGLYWQVSHPYYANYSMYNHVGAPNSRQCSNVAAKLRRGGVILPWPGHLRHLAADQLPPGRGQRHHVRRLGPVRQGHDQPLHLVGDRHPRLERTDQRQRF